MHHRLPQVGVALTLFPLCLRTLTIHSFTLAAVLRGREPMAGRWSLPGGKVRWGEGLVAAAVREAREELGVEVAPLRARGLPPAFCATDAIHAPGHHYALAHVCGVVALRSDGRLPALVAGDDAAGAAWLWAGGGEGGGALLDAGGAQLARLADREVAGDVAGVAAAARGWLRQHCAALEGGVYTVQ
jgi:8-oxo-dGTP diphosphatase